MALAPILKASYQRREKRLGQLLKAARKHLQLSQQVVADAMGFNSPSVLSRIESGTRTITALELETLAELYRREIADFATWDPADQNLRTYLSRIGLMGPLKKSQKKRKRQASVRKRTTRPGASAGNCLDNTSDVARS